MKNILIVFAFLVGTIVCQAQKERDVKLNKETNLIEATYYHDNGVVSQEGTFNLKGKLHGKWVSYNVAGEKISIGSYNNGVKTGKWQFLANNVLKEVVYTNNKIESVVEAKTKTAIVDRD